MSTIWLPGEPRGEQQPQVLSHPDYVTSSGSEATELAASAGLILDPWQEFSTEVILGERTDGGWAAFETGTLVARQNGKGGIIETVGLASLFLFGERLVLYSAHEFKTSQEHFLRMMELIENAPHLRKLCKKPRTSHGEEAFERIDGARLRFVARSRKSMRGFTGDRLIIDEAQELSRSAMGAALPTLRTLENPQVNYFGTVPEEVNDSEHWANLRERGHAGDDPSLAWLEWCSKSDDLDDEDNWKAANPALGIRIRREAFDNERRALGDEEFAREILSIWGASGRKPVIDPDLWLERRDVESKFTGKVTFAVDVPPEGQSAAIAVAGRREDGKVHVEVDRRDGTLWTVEKLVELTSKRNAVVVLDRRSQAGALFPSLVEAGVEVDAVGARDMTSACAHFLTLVEEDQLRHTGQLELTSAVDAARKRTVGQEGGWAWHRRDTAADISPLVAATLAVHGVSKPSKRRERTGRAVFV